MWIINSVSYVHILCELTNKTGCIRFIGVYLDCGQEGDSSSSQQGMATTHTSESQALIITQNWNTSLIISIQTTTYIDLFYCF